MKPKTWALAALFSCAAGCGHESAAPAAPSDTPVTASAFAQTPTDPAAAPPASTSTPAPEPTPTPTPAPVPVSDPAPSPQAPASPTAPPAPTPAPGTSPSPPPASAPLPLPPPIWSAGPVYLNDSFGRRPIFPPGHWWNEDISAAPVDPGSSGFIDFIGRTRGLHPDFGPPPYGIPYISVSRAQPLSPVTFTAYGSESDRGYGSEVGYPIPDEAKRLPNYIEGGAIGGGNSGDRHMLIVDRERWVLFELYATRWNAGANRWEAASGAVFDMSTMGRRPEGWTSADAAGLAILPGLVRYDEAASGREIGHAFRVTVRDTNGYVWPASHQAGSRAGALPMGARLRLKASKNLSGFPPMVQAIFRAMQRYGLIVADNGSDMYISGAMDSRWNNDQLNPAFSALKADDFEVVQLGLH